ncbi:hypothetical protein DER44DRAFT_869169 [Fusarium oxysporum]|nr:hypothetical protein DER44DRAFT_869169 [Fusarium oxysporum]
MSGAEAALLGVGILCNAMQIITFAKDSIHAKQILESPYSLGKGFGWIKVNLTKKQVDADKQNFAKMFNASNWRLYNTRELTQVAFDLQTALQVTIRNPTDEAGLDEKSICNVQKDAPQLNYKYVVNQLAPEAFKVDKVTLRTSQQYINYSHIIARTLTKAIRIFFVWKAVSTLSPVTEALSMNAYIKFRKELDGEDDTTLPPCWRSFLWLIDGAVDWNAFWD